MDFRIGGDKMGNNIKERSKVKLAGDIKSEVTSLFEKVLDYAQIACPDDHRFKILRGKVLRAGNDCIRSLTVALERYDIEYKPPGEDIIIKCNK